ncbi:DDB1- and CUL4-associated factor 8 isoform X1 [Leptinotarsa decemlineata]|uniref:DDB1- and CUL4-associated factor 8 isoform X1 n=1 Tax=Leptinotarsa decemlineata TaxID=7539 RepID=UPI003D30A06A
MEEELNSNTSNVDRIASDDSEDTISLNESQNLDDSDPDWYNPSNNSINSNVAEDILSISPPNHNWFSVHEVVNRQIGVRRNLRYPGSFQKRFHGSLHSVQRLELMHQLREHRNPIRSLNFNRTGAILSSMSQDGTVVIWDWNLKKCLHKYHSGHKMKAYHNLFVYLKGEHHIATCGADGEVRIAHVSLSEGVKSNILLETRPDFCLKLAGLNDQPYVLLSVGMDGIVLSHDIRKNGSEKVLQVTMPLFTVKGNPMKTMEFCIGGQGEKVETYDLRKTDIPLASIHPCEYIKDRATRRIFVTSVEYNHNGTEILASYNDDEIYLFDVNSKPGIFLKKYFGRHNYSLAMLNANFFGPNSEFVVSGSCTGHLFFWDKDTTSIVQWIKADYSYIKRGILSGPKKETSRGCILCDVCGGRDNI